MRGFFTPFALLGCLAVAGAPAGAVDTAPSAAPAVAASTAASPSAAPKKRIDPNLALVGGSADIVVKNARYYDTDDDNSSSSAQEILVATVVWTNNSGIDMTPVIQHFEFVDADGQISTGVDSGYTAFVGISNFAGSVKRGDSHQYTVGFLVPQGDAGQIIYDLSI